MQGLSHPGYSSSHLRCLVRFRPDRLAGDDDGADDGRYQECTQRTHFSPRLCGGRTKLPGRDKSCGGLDTTPANSPREAARYYIVRRTRPQQRARRAEQYASTRRQCFVSSQVAARWGVSSALHRDGESHRYLRTCLYTRRRRCKYVKCVRVGSTSAALRRMICTRADLRADQPSTSRPARNYVRTHRYRRVIARALEGELSYPQPMDRATYRHPAAIGRFGVRDSLA